MTGANDNDGRKVRALSELSRDIAPPRDLWQGIEAKLALEPRRATKSRATRLSEWTQPAKLKVLGTAAVVAALAIGVQIGRSWLPQSGKPGADATLSLDMQAGEPQALKAAYRLDPRYQRERAELVKSLEAKLNALPPDSRAKVVSSLATIDRSIKELRAALGRDPSNALLQELLVNTYQDEMRVLTTVHEAGSTSGGI